jgi:hypothetical protein
MSQRVVLGNPTSWPSAPPHGSTEGYKGQPSGIRIKFGVNKIAHLSCSSFKAARAMAATAINAAS